MAEIIKIASLDINVEALNAKAASAKAGIETLKKEIERLTDEQKNAEKQVEQYNVKLEKLSNNGFGNTKSADFFRQKITQTSTALGENRLKLHELEGALVANQSTMATQNILVQAYAEKQLEAAHSAKATQQNANLLGVSLSQNTQLYKNLTLEQQASASAGGKLLTAIKEQEAGYVALTGSASGYYSQLSADAVAVAEKEIALYKERNAAQESFKIQQLTNLEAKRTEDVANFEYELAFQMEQLEAKKAQELDYATQTATGLKEITAKNTQEKQAIEAEAANFKLGLVHDTFGSMATILGKESTAGKAAAVAQATIDTYKGATSAYAAMAGIPVVGPAMGAVAAAAAVALGLANVKKITNTKNKFSQGGLVPGALHTEGGVPFTVQGQGGYEMEGGEFVVNRTATSRFLPQLEAINAYGGNVSQTAGLGGNTTLFNYAELRNAVLEGAKLGAMEGTYSGSREGTMQGSRAGTKEGAQAGVASGFYERAVNEQIANGANF